MSSSIRLRLVFLLLVTSSALLSSWAAFGADYDKLIKRSAETWMPGVDWRLWKAQVHTESAFRAGAVSPVGAMGLSQLMPATWREISEKTGLRGNPFDPELNLMGGAWYMSRMRGIYKAPRPDRERHNLAAASYNAGAGNIIKAQRIAGNPAEWQPVADVLHQVTGRHSIETVNYVKRIRSTYRNYLIRSSESLGD